jgi:hypothetical protein
VLSEVGGRGLALVELSEVGVSGGAAWLIAVGEAGTLVTYLLNESGEPYMLLANNAAHTRNLLNNPKVALYVQNPKSPGQKGARVTLVGEIQKITSAAELKDCKEFYADRFPDQAQPLEDERFERFFSMYKIQLKDIYYVSGFGVTTCWVAPAEFSKAEADPLAAFSQQLLDEWNANRQDDYQSLAHAFFGDDLDVDEVDSPRITFLDRFGFDFRFRFPRKDQTSKPDGDKQVRLESGSSALCCQSSAGAGQGACAVLACRGQAS